MYVCFDGHNDVLLRLSLRQHEFFERGEEGHIDLPRAREGGLGGGFCAVFVPSTPPPDWAGPGSGPPLRMLPAPDLQSAQETARRMMDLLFNLERMAQGQLKIVHSADELDAYLHSGIFAALLHIEGAEPIDPDLTVLEELYCSGLRSLGPVWSRSNAFGHGVPFDFGHSPDIGPGLTDAGRALIRACNRLRIVVDLSHLNERGFWDVAELSDAPLVATHSNAWALSPSPRNLTDRQLDAIRESDGMVGVNFNVGFVRDDGRIDPDTPLETLVLHIEYLVERLGIDRVGFGSDFDGATMPRALGDVTGLPRLIEALARHGYDAPALRKLTHENWVRVLRKTWGA